MFIWDLTFVVLGRTETSVYKAVCVSFLHMMVMVGLTEEVNFEQWQEEGEVLSFKRMRG